MLRYRDIHKQSRYALCSQYLNILRQASVACRLAIFLASCLGVSTPCIAQERRSVSFRLDSDFRSRLATSGQSRTGLFSNTLFLDAHLNPNWRFRYQGRQTNAPNLTGEGDAMRINRFITQEALLEKEWGAQRLQLGIVRLPFGIYNHSETYASGLIDWPLVRVDYQFLAVDHGVPGVAWSGGNPRLQVETAWFGGKSSGVWNDLTNLGGAAFRLQTYQAGLILGYSRWDGYRTTIPPGLPDGARNGVHLNGLDVRYTRPHLLLRGEYIVGNSGGINVHGWYLDAYYHLPKYLRFTLTGRLEEFKPDPSIPLSKQMTFGLRYTLNSDWILAVNWRRNNGPTYKMTWTPPTGGGGDIFFQVYHKFPF